MRRFWVLFSRELRSILLSPVTYVVLTIFLLLFGLYFYISVRLLVEMRRTDYTMVQSYFLFGLFWISLLPFYPLLTMRLFSEEYKLKTIEPLLTAPVRDVEVVLAKFFAVVCLYALMFLPLLAYFYFFEQITGMPAADSPSAYFGAITIFLLSGMFYLSTGCFASAIARNQVVAGAVGLIIVTLFFFISFLVHVEWEVVSEFREVISYISTIEHVRDFSRGIFDTRPFVYYLSMTTFMLVLTTQVFQHHKWKS